MPASGRRAVADRNPARVLSVIALASIAAGAINLAAAGTIARGSAQNLAFFIVVGVAQIAWSAVAAVRAPRWWLALGALGNLVVVLTWAVSRTAGLPFGKYAHITLPVGFPDTLAMALEVVIVVGAVALMVGGQVPERSATRSPGMTVAAAVVLGGLTIGGVVSQANMFGSSSGGSAHSGTGSTISGTSGGGSAGAGSYGSSGSGTSGGGSTGAGSSGSTGSGTSGGGSTGGYGY
jgi:hypothetical protein